MIIRLWVVWEDIIGERNYEWFEKEWSCLTPIKTLHRLMKFHVMREISSRGELVTNIKELEIEYVESK